MLHFIKGRLADKSPGSVVIENAGLGFEIRVPDSSELFLYAAGDEVKLYTAMLVREDDISLYGFTDRHTLQAFRTLLTVRGIGAKAALAVLSVLTVPELHRAIAVEDFPTLMLANGVGKKTAQRMVLELKDKLDLLEGDFPLPTDKAPVGRAKEEAISALVTLGFTKSEAEEALVGITDPDLTVEEYIRRALSRT